MYYVKIENDVVAQYPYSVANLKSDNPNTSFPASVSDTVLERYGVHPVSFEAQPSYNPATERVEHSTSPVLKDGTWTITKTVVALNDEQIASYANHVSGKNREKRDKILANTDWTQMNDSPLSNEDKTAWATYRQELRDLTDLDAWPHLADEDWPVEP